MPAREEGALGCCLGTAAAFSGPGVVALGVLQDTQEELAALLRTKHAWHSQDPAAGAKRDARDGAAAAAAVVGAVVPGMGSAVSSAAAASAIF